MPTNAQVVKSINTGSLANAGLLKPEQSRKFIQQTFDATPLGKLVRHEMRTSPSGEIDKIGIASRILRKKTEGTDDGYRAGVKTSKVEYNCTSVRLPWEISNDTIRQNIEGEDFEDTVTDLMTKQLGVDLEDIYINGDTDVADTDPDFDFLKINDGWKKQILNSGHVFDASTVNSGKMNLDLFYNALRQIPNKYNNGNLRWLMSPRRAQEWELFLLNQIVNQGGVTPEKLYKSPASVPSIQVPGLDDGTILLTDPKNLIKINTYKIIIKKDDTSKEAIMTDKRFYVIHLDFDAVIEELDATAAIRGLSSII